MRRVSVEQFTHLLKYNATVKNQNYLIYKWSYLHFNTADLENKYTSEAEICTHIFRKSDFFEVRKGNSNIYFEFLEWEIYFHKPLKS